MNSNTQLVPVSKKRLWAGRVVSALPVLMLLFSGVMKLMKPPAVLQGFAHYGYPESLISVLGILEIVCTLVYLIPRASVLGAILMTGYLGGAVSTHVRAGSPLFETIFPVILGVLVWAGIFVRDAQLRQLVPLRR